jgi:hypothetical protein
VIKVAMAATIERDGELEYCVRSADEAYERVVGETDLGGLP